MFLTADTGTPTPSGISTPSVTPTPSVTSTPSVTPTPSDTSNILGHTSTPDDNSSTPGTSDLLGMYRMWVPFISCFILFYADSSLAAIIISIVVALIMFVFIIACLGVATFKWRRFVSLVPLYK